MACMNLPVPLMKRRPMDLSIHKSLPLPVVIYALPILQGVPFCPIKLTNGHMVEIPESGLRFRRSNLRLREIRPSLSGGVMKMQLVLSRLCFQWRSLVCIRSSLEYGRPGRTIDYRFFSKPKSWPKDRSYIKSGRCTRVFPAIPNR